MRLIDADECLERINNSDLGDGMKKMFQSLFNDIPTVNSEWISVKDGLPEESGE